jgi:uncharacterized membrane protein YkvA (DUF1232 family)
MNHPNLFKNDTMKKVNQMKKITYLRYTIQYIFDPEVPFGKKIWIILVLLYFFSPVDLIPDPLFGLGFIDDAIILFFTIMRMTKILEIYMQEKKNTNSAEKPGPTIEDVEYRIHED